MTEGTRTRVQAYEGVCIARSGGGLNENFTVRKISYGEGRRARLPGLFAGDRLDRGGPPRQGAPREALLPPRPARQVGPHRREAGPPLAHGRDRGRDRRAGAGAGREVARSAPAASRGGSGRPSPIRRHGVRGRRRWNPIFDANRLSWDERADIHVEDATGTYAIERLPCAARTSSHPIEANEIGDVAGLDVLHLQCHIGTRHALPRPSRRRVTGLDFSANALRHARKLAEKAGLDARFVLGNVYDAPALVGRVFDLVFTTWGTITWLPDMRRWGAAIALLLKPGGRLYFADFHPSLGILEEVDGKLVPTFNYRTPSSLPLEFTVTQTYTGDPRPLTNAQNFEWLHPVSDILMALIDNGLTIERIAEHEALPWGMFPMMVRGEDRLYRLPAGIPRLPLSISLSAVKVP